MKNAKSIFLTLITIICLIVVSYFIFFVTSGTYFDFSGDKQPSLNEETNDVKPEKQPSTEKTEEQRKERISEIDRMLSDELLVLVNADSGLEATDEPTEFLTVEGYRLEKTAGQQMLKMLNDMRSAGYQSMNIYSAFRNYAKQESNFNNKINQYINLGYDRDTAEKMAAEIVNPPGKSEHQTGLAADICTSEMVNKYGSLPEQFAQTPEYAWLYEHCDEYGFILRYPEDKEEITGITFEPWHYRYVGLEYAKEIMEQKICLEEYIDNLKQEKNTLSQTN